MFGQIATQIRAKRAQMWASRIDINGLSRFLRAQHPSQTAAEVSAFTGLPFASVRKWLAGDSVPGGVAITTLYLAYGPELLHAVVRDAPDWLSVAARDRAMRVLDAEIDQRRSARAKLAERA